jgi:hypothetical protein
MKYALFVYDAPSSWHAMPVEKRHGAHGEYHALAESPGVIGHYRFRPPEASTTVRVEDDQVVRSPGPLHDTAERALRALFLLESDDREAMLALAASTPAARMGGAVEVRPLAER